MRMSGVLPIHSKTLEKTFLQFTFASCAPVWFGPDLERLLNDEVLLYSFLLRLKPVSALRLNN
jgi:hypothetical protein